MTEIPLVKNEPNAKAFGDCVLAGDERIRKKLLAKPNKISILVAQKRRGRVAQ